MSIIKVLNGAGRYQNPDARSNVINYILRLDKAESGYIGYAQVHPLLIVESMDQVSIAARKTSGIQIRHFVLAFDEDELSEPEIADEIAGNILNFIGQSYQAVYAVHEDTPHIHIHFAFNPISYINGQRYRGTRAEYYGLINFIKKLLYFYGIHKLNEVSCQSEQDIQYE